MEESRTLVKYTEKTVSSFSHKGMFPLLHHIYSVVFFSFYCMGRGGKI